MAGPTLHAYFGVVAERRRRLLRQTHETAPQAWSVPSVADLQTAINRFVEETNSNPKPFVWTADPKRVLAAAGAAAGFLAGAIGAALYATHCPDDSPLFVAAWYSLAIGFVAALGAVAGSRLLRW